MKNKNINHCFLTDTHVLAPEIGQNFNEHFEVKDASFARGRFAQVRRCVHKLTSAECAAKVMRKYRRAVDVSAEIMHEVRVLLMADKERHIVNLLQVYESTSEYILVLEMAAGGELQRVLDDYDSIPEEKTKIMLRQLLNAVCFLHRNNIAHLDIKPQNILLSAPYPVGELKLCDFGISRLITNDTELREIAGTADYVAPEILHYEPIFLTTDMWSIGILTYVMLTGYTPFGGETKQETYLNITQGTLDFPEDLFSGISDTAIDFICKLLKKKPKQRLSSTECLEHEFLAMGEAQTNGEMQANESIANLPNNNSNGLNGAVIESIEESNQQPVSEECPVKATTNGNLNSSFKQVISEQELKLKQDVLEQNLINNNNEQTLKSSDLVSAQAAATKCESIVNELNNATCTPSSPQCTADEPSSEQIKNSNELNKSANELSSPPAHQNNSSDQAILSTISTSNSTSNEFTATCTNVTLLTAN